MSSKITSSKGISTLPGSIDQKKKKNAKPPKAQTIMIHSTENADANVSSTKTKKKSKDRPAEQQHNSQISSSNLSNNSCRKVSSKTSLVSSLAQFPHASSSSVKFHDLSSTKSKRSSSNLKVQGEPGNNIKSPSKTIIKKKKSVSHSSQGTAHQGKGNDANIKKYQSHSNHDDSFKNHNKLNNSERKLHDKTEELQSGTNDISQIAKASPTHSRQYYVSQGSHLNTASNNPSEFSVTKGANSKSTSTVRSSQLRNSGFINKECKDNTTTNNDPNSYQSQLRSDDSSSYSEMKENERNNQQKYQLDAQGNGLEDAIDQKNKNTVTQLKHKLHAILLSGQQQQQQQQQGQSYIATQDTNNRMEGRVIQENKQMLLEQQQEEQQQFVSINTGLPPASSSSQPGNDSAGSDGGQQLFQNEKISVIENVTSSGIPRSNSNFNGHNNNIISDGQSISQRNQSPSFAQAHMFRNSIHEREDHNGNNQEQKYHPNSATYQQQQQQQPQESLMDSYSKSRDKFSVFDLPRPMSNCNYQSSSGAALNNPARHIMNNTNSRDNTQFYSSSVKNSSSKKLIDSEIQLRELRMLNHNYEIQNLQLKVISLEKCLKQKDADQLTMQALHNQEITDLQAVISVLEKKLRDAEEMKKNEKERDSSMKYLETKIKEDEKHFKQQKTVWQRIYKELVEEIAVLKYELNQYNASVEQL